MALLRSSPPGRGQRLAVAVAVVIVAGWATCATGSQRAQDDRKATATARTSIRGPAPVVLKDGTRLQAESVVYSETEVRLRFADGHKEIYPVSAIDLEASKGLFRLLPAQPKHPQARRSNSKDLTSFARTTTLKIPEDDGQAQAKTGGTKAEGGTLSIAGPSHSSGAASGATNQTGQENSNLPSEVLAGIQGLANGWSGFDRALAEVRTICSGYIQGRASCGASAVVSKRHTAYCRAAINRARAHLPSLEPAHTRIWAEARRAGVSPGDVRAALRERGLIDFRNRIDRARSQLDAWQGNLVD